MALESGHRRQIAQFRLIIKNYLKLAEPASAWKCDHLGMTKTAFEDPKSLSPGDRQRAIVGSHLSSAAIRMASIDDVLEGAQVGRPTYSECNLFFNGSCRFRDTEPRAQTASDWLHVMLRDNAAHREANPQNVGTKDKRRAMRDATLRNISFAEAYSQLLKILGDLQGYLKQYGIDLPAD